MALLFQQSNFFGNFITFLEVSKLNQIKSFIILAVVRRSVLRVGGAHLRVIALGQHSSIRRNVAAVASHWQHCVRFDRREI